MLRPAVPADLPALLAIRDAADAGALSDPALIDEAGLTRLIAARCVMVREDDGVVAGFAAIDDGAIHLLVDAAARNRGVGRALLAAACAGLAEAGHRTATLSLAPGSSAERHYRAAGWSLGGETARGGLVLKKPF